MKNKRIMKTAALAAAVCMAAAILSGCNGNNSGNENNDGAGAQESVTTTVNTNTADTDVTVPETYGTKAVAEGDVYAINKFTVDPLPANYVLAQESQEAQGKLYLNGVSKITVMACNYKEDFQDLATCLETACVSLKMNNMLYACDTEFEEPVSTTVNGFEALSRDYVITQYDFIKEDPNAEGDGVKTPVAWYKSRIVYFFSDKDVYYCIFETNKDDWDSTIGGFEEFVANIKIDENAQNKPAETAAQ